MRSPPHDVQTNEKKLSKPPQNKDGYTIRTKGLYNYNNTSACNPSLMCTNREPIKLNNTRRVGFKNVCTLTPKRNIEMKQIPQL